MKLDIYPTREFTISTGGGERLACNQVFKKSQLLMNDIVVPVDLFLIDLAGTNVVLGTH